MYRQTDDSRQRLHKTLNNIAGVNIRFKVILKVMELVKSFQRFVMKTKAILKFIIH